MISGLIALVSGAVVASSMAYWAMRPRRTEAIAQTGTIEAPKIIEFDYQAPGGKLTRERLEDAQIQGPYLVGLDLERNQKRTFRLDRVTEWVNGSERFFATGEVAPNARRLVAAVPSSEMRHGGFGNEERAAAEAEARLYRGRKPILDA